MIKLARKYKSGSALEILQDAILSGEIPGGMMITQNEIADSLGVSRMPVREALIALEYQGLLERMPSQHVKVITLTDENIQEIFSDLAALESEALKNFPPEKIFFHDEQMQFHRAIRENISVPFKKKVHEILTEIYLFFVLKNSQESEKISDAFGKIFSEKNFCPYSEALSDEFINLRKVKKYAQLEAG